VTAQPQGRRRTALAGGLWFAAAQFVPFFGTALLSVVAGRLLGADRLGLQSLIAYAESAVYTVLVQSLTNACVRGLAAASGRGDRAGRGDLIRWTIRAHLATGAVAGLSLWLFALLRHDGEISWWLAGVSALATSGGWAYGSVIAGTTGFRDLGRARLIAQLGSAGLGILALLLGGDIQWIFLANIAASLWLTWVLRRRVRALAADAETEREPDADPVPAGEPDGASAGVGRLYGLFLLTELVFQVVARRSEFFFLDYFSTDAQIAMYSIAFMVVTVAVSIPAALGQAVMPVVAQALAASERDLVRDHLGRALRVTAVLATVLATALAAVGPSVVLLLYGPDYLEAARLTALAALAVLVVPVWTLCSEYWSGHGHLAPVLWTGAVGGALDLFAAWALIPRYAALGAVIANLIGQLVMGVGLIGYTYHSLGRFPVAGSRWAVLLAWCAVSGSGIWMVGQALPSGWAFCVTAVLAGALLLGGAVVIRPLHPDDARWLAELAPSRARGLIGRLAH
jgi:O-antigen/teichoic acid export membrane protein